MRARHPIVVGLLVLCMQALLLTPRVHAMPPPNLRVPQVAISGDGLQAYLDARGQDIDVQTEQDATQLWGALLCPGLFGLLLLELGAKSDGSSIGLYDTSAEAPTLFEVFPPQAGVGWVASVEFRGSPARVTVHLFDESWHPMGAATYLGGDHGSVGFYLHGPGGDFFTEDARNPAGDPQLLAFLDTGSYASDWWIAAEETPLSAGADRDFDDMILFVEWTDCPLPVQRSTWGAVKSRFR